MAVSLKGSADDKSTNTAIARSMGLAKTQVDAAPLAPQNPGHSKAPKAAPKATPMPTAKAVEMGLPSAMAALAANRKGPVKPDAPAPSIKGKTEAKKGSASDDDDADPDDDDELALGGDDSTVLAKYREKRMQELKQQSAKAETFKQLGHGSYSEVSQDEFLPAVTKSKYVVCHFYHPHFERCKIVDKHLSALAAMAAHNATKFISINSEKAPFFVTKLAIKTLPTIVLFKEGIAVDRIVGFDDLGAVDDFKTDVLAARIAKAGVIVIKPEKAEKPDATNSIRAATNNEDDAD